MVSLRDKKVRLTLGGNTVGEVSYAQVSRLLHDWKKGLLPEGVNPGAYIAQQLGLPSALESYHILQIAKSIEKMEEAQRDQLQEVIDGKREPEAVNPPNGEAFLSPSRENPPAGMSPSVPQKTSPTELYVVTSEEARFLLHINLMVKFALTGDASDFGAYVMKQAGLPDSAIQEIMRKIQEEKQIAQIQSLRGG